MLEAILLGLGAGIISSFLTGPVFFAMIKTSIERGFKAGLSLATGVIISDIILISIVLFSSHFFEYKASFDKYVGLIGGIFLLCVGVYYILSKVKLSYTAAQPEIVRKRSYIIKGFLMCILTPSTLMFWVIVSGIISVKLNDLLYEKILCLSIAILTQYLIDALKSYYSSKLRERIKLHTLKRLNQIAGYIIILFALWLIIKTCIRYF